MSRSVVATAAGFVLGLALLFGAAQLLRYEATDELPSVAPLPSLEQSLGDLAREKPPGEFRIFTIGASLTAGFPYSPHYGASYGKLLGDGLTALHPGRRIVARAIARPALDSPKLVRIVEAVLAYDPDLLIVTLGSNEYANRLFSAHRLVPDGPVSWIGDRASRTRLLWQALPLRELRLPEPPKNDTSVETELAERLVGRVDLARPGEPQLGALPFGPDERALLVARLRRSMRAIDDKARTADVPVVYGLAVYGLGRFWPWGHESEGDDAAIDELVLRVHHGRLADVKLAEVERLLEDGAERADLQFLHGLVLRRLGHAERARAAFERARDLDPVPIHQTGPIRDAIVEEAGASGRLLVDLDAPFRALAPDGIPGDEHYLDYGHLSVDGHRIVAGYLAKELHGAGLLPGNGAFASESFDRAVREVIDRTISEIERRYAWPKMAVANGNYGLLFGNFRDAFPYLRDAFRELPDDLENARRLIVCVAQLAGRTEEFGRGERVLQRVKALYVEMRQALAEKRLNAWCEAYLRGE